MAIILLFYYYAYVLTRACASWVKIFYMVVSWGSEWNNHVPKKSLFWFYNIELFFSIILLLCVYFDARMRAYNAVACSEGCMGLWWNYLTAKKSLLSFTIQKILMTFFYCVLWSALAREQDIAKKKKKFVVWKNSINIIYNLPQVSSWYL